MTAPARTPESHDWPQLALLAIIVVAGGVSQFFILTDIPARLAALGLIALFLWYHQSGALPRNLWLASAVVFAIPLFQLMPLPTALWSMVPGTERSLAVLRAAGVEPGWQQISVAPSRTFDSTLFLLVPLAALMFGYNADRRMRYRAFALLVALALVSLVLGGVQLLEGPGGRSYLYEVTSDGAAVGLFANRNHNGLFQALAIALLWPVVVLRAEDRPITRTARIWAIGLGAVLLGGAIMTGSQAALGLGALSFMALVAALMLTRTASPSARAPRPSEGADEQDRRIGLALPLVLAALGAVLVGGSAFLVLGSIADEGFDRAEVYPIIAAALKDYWLFGGGLGSFEWLARAYEDRETITFAYWNHAHNGFAQIVVETGVFGLVVLAGAGLWLVRVVRAYSRSLTEGLPRSPSVEAGLLALVLIAGHSLVDYPLRTAAISAVCFLLVGVIEGETRRRQSGPAGQPE